MSAGLQSQPENPSETNNWLLEEYKIIQAKIDKFGEDRFKVRSWSVTLVSGLVVGAHLSSLDVPAILLFATAAVFLFHFAWVRFKPLGLLSMATLFPLHPRNARTLVVIALLSAPRLLTAAEPRYQGRSLMAWLEDLQSEPGTAAYRGAEAAVREIGSAAVPTLLDDLKAGEEPSNTTVTAGSFASAEFRRNRAWRAFRILGPAAAPAVPDLVYMLAAGKQARLAARVLGMIGPAACNPESVAALADLSLRADPLPPRSGVLGSWPPGSFYSGEAIDLARTAVETLRGWGTSASNAVPQLLRGLKAQTEAGGPSRSAMLPPSPDFAGALAEIGPDSREVLLALLSAKTSIGGGGALDRWCRNSSQGRPLLQSVVMDRSIPVPQRNRAILFFDYKKDTNLLAVIPELLNESQLRPSLLPYLNRLGPEAAPIFPTLIKAAENSSHSDPKFAEQAFMIVGRNGRGPAATLISQLLPLTFDERYPINMFIPADEAVPACISARFALEQAVGGPEQLVPILIESLRDPDWKIRNASAARLWGVFSLPPEAITRLAKCLTDTNEVVRLSAAVTLARLPAYRSRVVTNLLAAASSPTLSGALRLHSLRQLGQRQLKLNEFPDAARVLTAAAHDPDASIRQAASRILADIRK